MGGLIRSGARHATAPMLGEDPMLFGSTVSNPNGPAQKASPADMAAAEAAQAKLWQDQQMAERARHHEQAQGFMGSMMPTGHAGMVAGFGKTSPVAPPPQWTYQPGKGPVWQTPEKTINPQGTDAQSMNWKLTDSKPGSPYGGNRF